MERLSEEDIIGTTSKQGYGTIVSRGGNTNAGYCFGREEVRIGKNFAGCPY
jgi:hypothetical protein